MIFVDGREGSAGVLESLVKAGLPAEKAVPDLPAGDVYFVGRGVAGAPLNIGIEHKQLSDVVSSLKTARLQGHQLPMMRAAEQGESPAYDLCWLVVEGEWHTSAKGELLRRVGRQKFARMGMTTDELLKRLTVLHLCGGLNWVRCPTRTDTVRWISALYRTLTDKDMDQHKSHLGIYQAPTLVPVSQFVQTVATLPGVHLKAGRAAEKRFGGSIQRAINACPAEWAQLELVDDSGKVKHFGLSRATKLVESVK